MADSSSGGGAGGVSPFLTYGYDQMKEMAYADNPAAISGHAARWAQAARDLRIFQQMLHEELDSLSGVYSSAAGAPALMRSLSEKASKLEDVAARFERNAQALEVAALALRRARAKLEAIEPTANHDTGVTWRDASQMGPMARQAAPVMDELASAYDLTREQLDFEPLGNVDDPRNSPSPNGGTTTYVTAPGPTGSSGPGGPVPSSRGPAHGARADKGTTPSGWPPSGGRTPLSPGSARSISGAAPNTGRGGTTAGRVGMGTESTGASGPRVRMPGARSGAPIGGYRPTAGTSGAGASGTSSPTPSHGGPGGPGRPGTGPMPPGGQGAVPGGKDNRGRRLTDYERLEPDTFRDTRHRTKPVLGDQRRKPDSFRATPGTIGAGNKESDNKAPKLPDLPTAEAPARFEGHDVHFGRRSRRGP